MVCAGIQAKYIIMAAEVRKERAPSLSIDSVCMRNSHAEAQRNVVQTLESRWQILELSGE